MDAAAPIALLLSAGPTAPGAAAVFGRASAAEAAGREVRVLLTAGGLAWARDARLVALAGRVDVAVCSQDARAAGWRAETTPTGVRWSSVGTWLAERAAAGSHALWSVLP